MFRPLEHLFDLPVDVLRPMGTRHRLHDPVGRGQHIFKAGRLAMQVVGGTRL